MMPSALTAALQQTHRLQQGNDTSLIQAEWSDKFIQEMRIHQGAISPV